MILALAVLEGDSHSIPVGLGRLDPGARVDGHAPLLEGASHLFGAVRILQRKDPVQSLDDRDLRTVCVIDVGELHAHGARSYHDQAPRGRLLEEGARGRPDALLIDLQEGQVPRPRTGRDDDVLRLEDLLVAVLLYLDLPSPKEPAVPLDVGHLVLPEEELDPLGHLLRDGPAPLLRGTQVGLEAVERDTVAFGVGKLVHEEGRGEKRLGGDASDVQADPAELVDLYAGRVQTELGGPNGGHIATRPAPDHDDVERRFPAVLCSHRSTSWKSGPRSPGARKRRPGR